jgi:hypothetical protein
MLILAVPEVIADILHAAPKRSYASLSDETALRDRAADETIRPLHTCLAVTTAIPQERKLPTTSSPTSSMSTSYKILMEYFELHEKLSNLKNELNPLCGKATALAEEMKIKLQAIIRLEEEIGHKRQTIPPEVIWSFFDNDVVPELMRQKKRTKIDNKQIGPGGGK